MRAMPPLVKKTMVGLIASAACAVAMAAQVVVTASLTGDPRPTNPDNLFIDVTITFDDTTNIANWVIDINSPLHPNAKLDEFYFSMLGAGSDYSFSNFSPADWDVNTPATVQGGGAGNPNPTFMFEALDPAGPPNAADVTNSQNLTFTMTKLVGGNLTTADFLNATAFCSSDATLGCGQLGAHLQSLTVPAGTTGISDSGFLLGNYEEGGGGEQEAPEPMTLALVGLGLMAAAGARRRQARNA